ncbi:MAG: lysophospholipase [Anaerolineales bacterium]
MTHQDGTFQNSKGQEIYYQTWLPEDQPRGVIQIVHGLNEHSGRYQHLGKFFSDHGFAVYGLDFPGHGKSAGIRSYVESMDVFTCTLQEFLQKVQDWHPDLPIFLLGHSMGGLIGSVYLLDQQDVVRGAVLSGSLVKVPEYVSDFTISLGRFLGRYLPKVRILGIDIEGISRDPQVVESYRNDPLVYTGKITARISDALNRGIQLLEEHGSKIKVPLLILHGGEDRLCDPSWSEYLADLVSSQDLELKIYPGLFHEIYNEPEQDQIFNDVLIWLRDRT